MLITEVRLGHSIKVGDSTVKMVMGERNKVRLAINSDLVTELRKGIIIEVGRATIQMVMSSCNRVRLAIDADPEIKIEYEQDSAHKNDLKDK